MMIRQPWLLGAALVACLCLAAQPPAADAPKKDDAKKGADEEAVKAEKAGEDVANLAMAYRLVELGRKEKMPEALITAARILGKVSIKSVETKPVVEKEPKEGVVPQEVKTELKAGEATDFFDEAKALLAEAKEMAKKNEHLAALADAALEKLTKARGAVGGPKQIVNGLAPGQSNIFSLPFVGRTPAQVLVRSNNGAWLRLEVFNPVQGRQPIPLPLPIDPGNPVQQPIPLPNPNNPGMGLIGAVRVANWLPPATQFYIVRVTNLSSAATVYQLLTN